MFTKQPMVSFFVFFNFLFLILPNRRPGFNKPPNDKELRRASSVALFVF